MRQVRLSVSVVTYRPDLVLLDRTLSSFCAAIRHARASGVPGLQAQVTIVDNGDTLGREPWGTLLRDSDVRFELLGGHGNLGYGRGNNLAIERAVSDFHLVLNPDVEVTEDCMREALRFMAEHPSLALLAPHTVGDDGQLQYLCRRYPSVADLMLRGFVPKRVRHLFDARLSRYELREETNASIRALCTGQADPAAIMWNPPIVSGCFMFYRTATLKRLGGFDARYFLYFEDYDLSLRTSRMSETAVAFVPRVRIVHSGGKAARKGWFHIRLFSVSAFRFFSRFGWRWY